MVTTSDFDSENGGSSPPEAAKKIDPWDVRLDFTEHTGRATHMPTGIYTEWEGQLTTEVVMDRLTDAVNGIDWRSRLRVSYRWDE